MRVVAAGVLQRPDVGAVGRRQGDGRVDGTPRAGGHRQHGGRGADARAHEREAVRIDVRARAQPADRAKRVATAVAVDHRRPRLVGERGEARGVQVADEPVPLLGAAADLVQENDRRGRLAGGDVLGRHALAIGRCEPDGLGGRRRRRRRRRARRRPRCADDPARRVHRFPRSRRQRERPPRARRPDPVRRVHSRPPPAVAADGSAASVSSAHPRLASISAMPRRRLCSRCSAAASLSSSNVRSISR